MSFFGDASAGPAGSRGGVLLRFIPPASGDPLSLERSSSSAAAAHSFLEEKEGASAESDERLAGFAQTGVFAETALTVDAAPESAAAWSDEEFLRSLVSLENALQLGNDLGDGSCVRHSSSWKKVDVLEVLTEGVFKTLYCLCKCAP